MRGEENVAIEANGQSGGAYRFVGVTRANEEQRREDEDTGDQQGDPIHEPSMRLG